MDEELLMSYDAVGSAETPTEPPPPTPTRLRVLLAHYTGRQPENYSNASWQALLELPESKRPPAIAGANIDVAFLCTMGCRKAQEIRLAGIDTVALLIDHLHIEQLLARFPPEQIRSTYLASSSDAVLLAGSHVAERLLLSMSDLLRRCVGKRQEAHACIEQTLEVWRAHTAARGGGIRIASPLVTVTPRLLLDCNVTLPAIANFSVDLYTDVDTHGLTLAELKMLGLPLLTM